MVSFMLYLLSETTALRRQRDINEKFSRGLTFVLFFRSSKKVHHPPAVNLVKEFTEFKKSNVLRTPEPTKEQDKRSKDDSLEKIDQLENLIVTKEEPRDLSTTTKTTFKDTITSTKESKVVEDETSNNQTTQATEGLIPETPKTLSLTSDSHQKRGTLEDLNQDDGMSAMC